MHDKSLRDFHDRYVKSVGPGEFVVVEMLLLTTLTNEVAETTGIPAAKVHVRSIALKHIYEKRNAYEYDVILDNLDQFVRYPDRVYQNKDKKKADYIFVKEFEENLYAALLKQNAHPEAGQEITVVVTAYKTNETYLKKFELLRSWKDGTPSS